MILKDIAMECYYWIRNRITTNGAASECSTTAETTHDESTPEVTLKIDHAEIKCYLKGDAETLSADSDVVVWTDDDADPFDYDNDLVDVVVACFVYDKSGTATVSGLCGKAAESGEAEAPSDDEISDYLGTQEFVRFANVTFVASSTSACAFSETSATEPMVGD